MHIAALDPKYVRREEVTPEMLETEREIYRAQALATGKPEPVVEKIVTGKMEKFYEDNCLYEQHYIKDEGPRFARWWPAPWRSLAKTSASSGSRGSRLAK
jgi:translation elongation factor EF-Ts